MALLNKKLYIQPNGEAATGCNLYSTKTEVGCDYITVSDFNIEAYAKLGGTSDAFNTKGRVKKASNTYVILSQAKPAYNKLTYTTPGNYTFTVPLGVIKVIVTVAAAGGGGGGGAHISHGSHYYGGSGGRGGLNTAYINVSPGQIYTLYVGAGGLGGINGYYSTGCTDGGNGQDSYCGNSLRAIGGGGGKHALINYGSEYDYPYGNGANGASYGTGGSGGTSGNWSNGSAGSGGNGWIYIEYGGDI